MDKKKVLFVCTANYYRSITAEIIFKKWEKLEVRSAGTHNFAEKVINNEMINWADIIFVMEDHHKSSILALMPKSGEKIIVLEIPDIYQRNDPVLVKILQEKITPYLIDYK